MRLCDSKTLVEKAREQGYAVPAFNTNGATYDITRAAIEAAEELRSPLILQTYEPNCAYRGYEYMFLQAVHLAQDATIPIALHLDHGSTFTSALQCVKAGYTSIMIDGSHLPLDENIRLTKQIVEALQPLGITVEAEVGHVTGGVHSAAHAAHRTDPDEAAKLVEETGVDLLAISNGTQHGVIELQDDIDFELVKSLRKRIPVPLVQHGTSGIPLAMVTELGRCGMAKINFGEPFRANYIKYFKEFADTLDHKDHPWKIMWAIKDRLKEDMKQLIVALGSAGKA
jgi:fructose-bisphosphate aldolase class II